MLTDQFADEPFFPYPDYATDLQHFIAAQRYWLTLLRVVPAFEEGRWHPVLRPVDIVADQSQGLMYWLRNSAEAKEISLHTNSLAGCATELLRDNPPMTAGAVAQASTDFGWEPSVRDIRGMSMQEASAAAAEIYTPFSAWVDAIEIYHPDPSHSEGGWMAPAERLILVSEVSADYELDCIRALRAFLEPGTAAARVSSLFSATNPQ